MSSVQLPTAISAHLIQLFVMTVVLAMEEIAQQVAHPVLFSTVMTVPLIHLMAVTPAQ